MDLKTFRCSTPSSVSSHERKRRLELPLHSLTFQTFSLICFSRKAACFNRPSHVPLMLVTSRHSHAVFKCLTTDQNKSWFPNQTLNHAMLAKGLYSASSQFLQAQPTFTVQTSHCVSKKLTPKHWTPFSKALAPHLARTVLICTIRRGRDSSLLWKGFVSYFEIEPLVPPPLAVVFCLILLPMLLSNYLVIGYITLSPSSFFCPHTLYRFAKYSVRSHL